MKRERETHGIPLHQLLVVGHSCQPDDGDDRVQDEGEEEVFVERDPLAAQAPARRGRSDVRSEQDLPLSLQSGAGPETLPHLLKMEEYPQGDEERGQRQSVSDQS